MSKILSEKNGEAEWVDDKLPDPVVADANKYVKVNSQGTGYELVTIQSANGVSF